MKVLFLFTRPLFPLNTGAKIRTFNLLKGVSKYHDITFAAFANSPSEQAELNQVAKYCKKVIALKSKPFGTLQLGLLVLKNLFSRLPLTIQKYWSPEAKAQLDREVKSTRYDLIHCDQPHLAPYIEDYKSIPKLLNEHNIEAQITRRYAENSESELKRKFLLWQWQKMKRYELALWQKFDMITVVSQVDLATLLSACPTANVMEISNGVDTDYFSPNGIVEEPKNLLFTGSMDWLPNEDAVGYFVEKIWPHVYNRFPDAKFYIVGRNPGAKVRDLKAVKGIEVTGTVPDVRPFMKRCNLFIVPLRIGGGSRLKILEALSMQKKVISTSIGCEGLDVTPEENILVADSPEAFAQEIIKAWTKPDKQSQLGERGRNLVLEKYDWRIIAKKLNMVYEQTVKGS